MPELTECRLCHRVDRLLERHACAHRRAERNPVEVQWRVVYSVRREDGTEWGRSIGGFDSRAKAEKRLHRLRAVVGRDLIHGVVERREVGPWEPADPPGVSQ